MKPSEAEALVAVVQAYFPNPKLPPSTVTAWATELEGYDFDDVREAARRLAIERSYPALAGLLELVDEVRVEREQLGPAERLALPPGEFLAEMPPDVRKKVEKLREKWAEDAEHGKEEVEWKRKKAAIVSSPTLRAAPRVDGPLVLVEVPPNHPCDRCGHASKMHAGPDRGSACMIVSGRVFRGARVPKGLRAKQCLCDGYFPRPRFEEGDPGPIGLEP